MRFLQAAIEVDSTGVIVGKSFGFVRATATPVANVYPFLLHPEIDARQCTPVAVVTGDLSGIASPGAVGAGDQALSVTTYTGASVLGPRGFHLLVFGRTGTGASLIGDGGIGRLHSSVEVGNEPAPGTYVGRRLRVTGTIAGVAVAIYTITLAEAIDPTDRAVHASVVGGAVAPGLVSIVTGGTDTTVRVGTFDMGAGPAPVNKAFNLDVWRKGIG